jgi:beta-ribofuranosylaminobenzene 5'-phosphate synthase
VIVRHDVPEDWRILVAIPSVPPGASGTREADIFRQYCPVPLGEVRELCHEVLMRMLPALVEHDLDRFGSSINAVQTLGFKKIELSLQPPQINELLDVMRSAGAAGAGMSSFGPALYAFCDTNVPAVKVAADAFMNEWCGGTAFITSARNRGAAVRIA